MNKKERLFYLDFIRALSVIFIVVYHYNILIEKYSVKGHKILFQAYPNGDLGKIGVSLFFIISGAALMFTYQDDFSIKHFFKKRFSALYPMFWTAYSIAFLYFFYMNKSIKFSVPKWRFILSIFGVDGYLLYAIRNYYILGEWFLGCIILIYICFPLIRKCVIKYPKLLIICGSIIYFIVIENYSFKMQIDRNLITRLPEFIFGMYFIKYIKKINIYEFSLALCVSIFMFIKEINLNQMYKITITGISLFIVLTFIGNYIRSDRFKKPFVFISKYSYPTFLIHYVIITQLIIRFKGMRISFVESYCLFMIVCIVIGVIAINLDKLSNRLSGYLKIDN